MNKILSSQKIKARIYKGLEKLINSGRWAMKMSTAFALNHLDLQSTFDSYAIKMLQAIMTSERVPTSIFLKKKNIFRKCLKQA